MKKSLLFVVAFATLTFINSCREDLITKSEEPTVLISDATAKDGRLYFANKESLQATYKLLKNKSSDDVANYISSKGINSLIPIITSSNEGKVMQELKDRKINFLQSNKNVTGKNMGAVSITDGDVINDLDDMEEIVGDDAYAAMLNGEAEIQVANQIYKYTDVGLFITPDTNYNQLTQYLAVNDISSNLVSPTDDRVKSAYVENKTPNQLITVDQNIDYYNNRIAPITTLEDGDGGGGYGGGGYGGGGNGSGNPPVEPSLANIIQGLKVGDVRKPPLGNIFGTTWETDDQYEGKRRVKVKFYSQNLWLVYAVGCKVKHQYKGWTGLWRKENADQLGVGVNSISWTFTHSTQTSPPQGVPKQAYWFGSNMYTTVNGISFTFQQNQNIPSLPFASDLDGVIQFVTDFTGLTDDQLDKLFWDNAWKQANKFLEGQNKKLNKVAFIVDSHSSTYVRYYDFSQIEYNQDCIERIFDWGIATPQFTYTFGGGVGNGVSLTSYKFDFINAKATSIDMYGIAKKDGGWHGVKLIAK
jgi:hypothetical protein